MAAALYGTFLTLAALAAALCAPVAYAGSREGSVMWVNPMKTDYYINMKDKSECVIDAGKSWLKVPAGEHPEYPVKISSPCGDTSFFITWEFSMMYLGKHVTLRITYTEVNPDAKAIGVVSVSPSARFLFTAECGTNRRPCRGVFEAASVQGTAVRVAAIPLAVVTKSLASEFMGARSK
ncbi:hypothetical protein [Bordetella bronchialis]|uniref:Uncharacterized protein n=1 Tax=Bordetella bronchialis TaxID=463025 RepID=A0A193FUR0_9BORD|nr:hypothetical protein [Bordetella bronchialis]ANN66413.1 hypothetical protein BAU06_09025 [Bordetella bronchialis]ANN71492.1 hypothetical protein BAU08_09245 [Bordetella bronchialis]